ncbi:MAG TPA: LPS export ABC transporter permease LptF [Candidatus Limnocylindrales bacterium]|nr:LPS export ABC transporter permease LptF [Candidatus Limnocylindrales bacterium]
MRLLDRYIGSEVASHAALGLAVFTFVFFIPQLVRLMDLVVRHSGGIGTVALLFLCLLPPVLVFAIPMAVLVGVLIGLGRLSADSEIVALHASGISLRRLLLPIGFVAAGCSAVTLLITLWLSPLSLRTLRGLEDKILSSQAPYAVQPRVFDERFPRFVLYVQDVTAAATRWSDVFLASSGSSQTSTITTAKSALVLSGTSRNTVEIHLDAGSTHEYDPRDPDRYNVTTFGESDIPISGSRSTSTSASIAGTDAELYLPALLRAPGSDWRDAHIEIQRRLAFPAACLVFALLGVPIGVRPRRGGRAAGMILTLVLIGGYYFVFVTGDHMAQQGSISPWVGIWAANIVAAVVGLAFLRRIENIRRPNRFVVWLDSVWRRFRTSLRPSASALSVPTSNGPISQTIANGSAANGISPASQAVRGIRTALAKRPFGFPMLVDVYLLQRFFYYFLVLLAGFVLIFDAFTLFDLLGDISKNHVGPEVVLNYFRFLVPYMVYLLAPLATLVATLVTLAVLAKNNEVVAFKASGISLYRLILPLALAGCLVAGGMFLMGETFLPYANQRQDALRAQIKGRPAQTYFQPTHLWIFGEHDKIYNYEFFDPLRQLFGGLNVFELDPQTFAIRRRVFASRATWEPTENTWVLTGGWVRDFDDGHITKFTPFQATSLAELSEPPTYFSREVRQSDQMDWRELGDYISGLRHAGFDTARLTVQWHEKFAFPLIAVIVVCLGAPFALLVGTRGAIGGLALAVAIGIFYRAIAALLESMGSVGLLPAILAGWAPDAIFGFLAVYFFLKMPT